MKRYNDYVEMQNSNSQCEKTDSKFADGLNRNQFTEGINTNIWKHLNRYSNVRKDYLKVSKKGLGSETVF